MNEKKELILQAATTPKTPESPTVFILLITPISSGFYPDNNLKKQDFKLFAECTTETPNPRQGK